MAKLAFITGASSGIGAELATQLAAQGYNLALLARRRSLLEELSTQIKQSQPKCQILVHEADVTNFEELQSAVKATEASLGPIDLMVGNAGVLRHSKLDAFDAAGARDVFAVNVIGLMHSCAAVLPSMIERKAGTIVGISSLAGYLPASRGGVYSASKAAATSYLRGLTIDAKPFGIKVVCVCPGFIETAMTAKMKRSSMPGLLTVNEAVRRILDGIARGQTVINFPWSTYLGVRITRLFPALMGMPIKY